MKNMNHVKGTGSRANVEGIVLYPLDAPDKYMVYIFEQQKSLHRVPLSKFTDLARVPTRFKVSGLGLTHAQVLKMPAVESTPPLPVPEEATAAEHIAPPTASSPIVTSAVPTEPTEDTEDWRPASDLCRSSRRRANARNKALSALEALPEPVPVTRRSRQDMESACLSISEKLSQLHGGSGKAGCIPLPGASNPSVIACMSITDAIKLQPAREAEIRAAVHTEVKQLVDNGMFEPIDLAVPGISGTVAKRLLRGKFDVVFKTKTTGEHDKTKCRGLVNPLSNPTEMARRQADGGKPSSPTASHDSLWVHLALAAVQKRIVTCFDIRMAFMHCLLKHGDHYYYRISAAIADILLAMSPEYLPGLRPDGSLIVKLVGTVYGLPESSLYFYNLFDAKLIQNGYMRSEADPCVYTTDAGSRVDLNITKDGIGSLHVDDCLASFANKGEELAFRAFLSRSFKLGFTAQSLDQEGGVSHLGYHIMRNQETFDIHVGQPGYENKVIRVRGGLGIVAADAPHTARLFRINPNSPKLSQQQKEVFHSTTMELGFLSRTRIALMPSLSFLRQRVTQPTQEDAGKALHAIRYLVGHPQEVRTLRHKSSLQVNIHTDGGHASHADYKGHTGVAVFMGINLIAVICSKQKLQTHSSAETELVAIADGGLLIKKLAISMGATENIGRPTPVYQDNKSSIIIANRGHGTNRHIGKRFFGIKEEVECGNIKLIYTHSSDLVADVLTKPLRGEAFHRHINTLMNNRV